MTEITTDQLYAVLNAGGFNGFLQVIQDASKDGPPKIIVNEETLKATLDRFNSEIDKLESEARQSAIKHDNYQRQPSRGSFIGTGLGLLAAAASGYRMHKTLFTDKEKKNASLVQHDKNWVTNQEIMTDSVVVLTMGFSGFLAGWSLSKGPTLMKYQREVEDLNQRIKRLKAAVEIREKPADSERIASPGR